MSEEWQSVRRGERERESEEIVGISNIFADERKLLLLVQRSKFTVRSSGSALHRSAISNSISFISFFCCVFSLLFCFFFPFFIQYHRSKCKSRRKRRPKEINYDSYRFAETICCEPLSQCAQFMCTRNSFGGGLKY